MDSSRPKSRSQSHARKPLGDAASRANIDSPSPCSRKTMSGPSPAPSSSGLPHHESVSRNGGLTVQNATASPDNKRISAITNESQDDKRNSQVSTASTNASSRGLKKKSHIGPWRLGSSIGNGMVGKVRKVQHCVTGQVAAAKIIPKKLAEKARAESMANLVHITSSKVADGVVLPLGVEREVVILKLLDHPNIVRLFDVWENRNELYLVMEYVDGGELFDWVNDVGSLEEDETVWIFRQIVAALLHAHRLGIYHRDLKPENILLTRSTDPVTGNENPQVKLVDFGMAALQPAGKNLSTACGSVHYAAPEVFEKNYSGNKVDVWSLGVILFVMLTGQIPFVVDVGESHPDFMTLWYREIKTGKFVMPPHLSQEAQNLISRMLNPDPRRRLCLDEVWSHPLFLKWSRTWGETNEDVKLDNWIGSTPRIGKFRIDSRKDIDRELLRNLQTLWHSEKEETLIKRLLNDQPNLEKVFYTALQKHCEEQRENYIGVPDDIGHSTSDYHHMRALLHPSELPPLPASAFTRTGSQFSILDDSMPRSRSRASLPKSTASQRSYDPYRASRTPMVADKENYNVTVHRDGSNRSGITNARSSIRAQSSLRVAALKKQQSRISYRSSASFTRQGSPSPRARSRRTISRASMVSSTYPSSPPSALHVKTGGAHKRGVDFSHVRRSSTVSAMPAKSHNATPKTRPGTAGGRSESLQDVSELQSSPLADKKNAVVSKKEHLLHEVQRERLRRAKAAPSGSIDHEARIVSTELERFCEEAFNRDSGQSSTATSGTYSQTTYDTPPSSVTNRGSIRSNMSMDKTASQRPLPDVPPETPDTYLQRELAEMKRRLNEKYKADQRAQNSDYIDVMAHIDSLLGAGAARHNPVDTRRAASNPGPNAPEALAGYLPIISEESRTSDVDEQHTSRGRVRSLEDHLSALPSRSRNRTHAEPASTIKLIDQAGPPHVAPLNVRKVSTVSSNSSRSSRPHSQVNKPAETVRYYSSHSRPVVVAPTRHVYPPPDIVPQPFDEIRVAKQGVERQDGANDGQKLTPKRRGWWRRRFVSEEMSKPADWRQTNEMGNHQSQGRSLTPTRADEGRSEGTFKAQSVSPKVMIPGKRPGFLSFLNRGRLTKQTEQRKFIQGDNGSTVSHSNSTRAASSTGGGSARGPRDFYQQRHQARSAVVSQISEASESTSPDLGVQRNWLARFLHIKPASHVMCFCIGRGHMREELFRMLRNWRTYGMKDVTLGSGKNLIFGRVDADNYLGLKEVAFVIELFVVLERGQRAKLSIARFTQRKGAASSFRKVVETVETRVEQRGLLVRDGARRREMERILQG